MLPTLEKGQRVLVNRFTYKLGADPSVGDVVVFHPPLGAQHDACGVAHPDDQACPQPTDEMWDNNFIKRVVAGPGDTLTVRGGIPIVNGEPVQGDWEIEPCGDFPVCNLTKPITIPPDHYFMMGDNRGESDDSRFWGPVPRDWIIGGAFATYWPPNRIGLL